MRKASAPELRKSIALTDALVQAGIRFVPMPVFDEADYQEHVAELDYRMSQIVKEAGGLEGNDVE